MGHWAFVEEWKRLSHRMDQPHAFERGKISGTNLVLGFDRRDPGRSDLLFLFVAGQSREGMGWTTSSSGQFGPNGSHRTERTIDQHVLGRQGVFSDSGKSQVTVS
jgi:hypothetical protein